MHGQKIIKLCIKPITKCTGTPSYLILEHHQTSSSTFSTFLAGGFPGRLTSVHS